jgi:hypothetical protein
MNSFVFSIFYFLIYLKHKSKSRLVSYMIQPIILSHFLLKLLINLMLLYLALDLHMHKNMKIRIVVYLHHLNCLLIRIMFNLERYLDFYKLSYFSDMMTSFFITVKRIIYYMKAYKKLFIYINILMNI